MQAALCPGTVLLFIAARRMTLPNALHPPLVKSGGLRCAYKSAHKPGTSYQRTTTAARRARATPCWGAVERLFAEIRNARIADVDARAVVDDAEVVGAVHIGVVDAAMRAGPVIDADVAAVASLRQGAICPVKRHLDDTKRATANPLMLTRRIGPH